jgi:hypothetical protein
LFEQQRRRRGRIDPAAHSNHDPNVFSLIHCR